MLTATHKIFAALSALALLIVVSVSSSFAAFAAGKDDPGRVEVAPGDQRGFLTPPYIDLSATSPGSGGSNSTSHSSGVVQDSALPKCTYSRLSWSPSMMAAIAAITGKTATMGVAGSPTLGGDQQAAYWADCPGGLSGWTLGPSQLGTGPAALPTPQQLADQAAKQMVLPLPVPRHSPDVRLSTGQSATVVGEHTWLWTDATTWTPLTKRVQVGPVWAEVKATPTNMNFDSGMQSTVACSGPGTPYDPSRGGHAASPDCDMVYVRSSIGMPHDQTTATYSIQWSVAWTGFTGTDPASGTLPIMTSRATASFAVVEIQALRS